MIKSKSFLCLAVVASLTISCNNDIYTPTPEPESRVDTLYVTDTLAVPVPCPPEVNCGEIYSCKTYTQDEFVEFIGRSFDDYFSSFLTEKCNIIPRRVIASVFEDKSAAVDSVVADELDCCILFARNKWGVKVYNFTYSTTSYTDEPIILSAALCVPVLLDGTTPHKLSALSLCPPAMPIDKEFCPTVNGNILSSRVAFNHAVVVPDYQGRGITASGPYSSMHTHAHALQALDAALVARNILERDGFGIPEDFPLYDIGVSEGGEVAYEVQELLENEFPQALQDSLNLKLSFCANGILRHAVYVDSQIASYKYETEELHQIWMGFYDDAFSCLSDEEKQGHDGSEFYSHDLLDSTGRIIPDAAIFSVLKEAFVKNDITWNWNPKHSITLAASHDDDDVFFDDHTAYGYELLRNSPDGTPNENVQLSDFYTPHASLISDIIGPDYMIAHIAADICCFIHAIKYEDPGSEPILPYFDE